MKLAAIASALLLALSALTAQAGEGCRSACAEGYSWSSETGTCVPSPVSS